MALKPEERAEWILSKLEHHESSVGEAPPGVTEVELAELDRDTADCREMWRALEMLNEGIESETVSPGARSAFQERLAAAVARERSRPVSRTPRAEILRGVPRPTSMGLAAAAALLVIASLTLWRPAPWSQRELSWKGDRAGFPGPMSHSASSRLDAVLRSGENGPTTVSKLNRVLVSDPNPNIRLAALDVLAGRFAKSGLEGQIAGALVTESDPLVRLELIRTIGEHQLVNDGAVLRKLALDPRLDDLARDEISRVMARLGS